jgi:uncharacterized protein (DUF983 family)
LSTSQDIPIQQLLADAWSCSCPRCHEGRLFPANKLSIDVLPSCDVCGLSLSGADSADGPAVFLIFILGFALVPLALLLEVWFAPPLWVHAVLWSIVTLALIFLSMRPTKAFVIGLQYQVRQKKDEAPHE